MGPLKILGKGILLIAFLLLLLELRLRIVDAEKDLPSKEGKQTVLIMGDSITKEMTPGGSYSKKLQELLDRDPGCSKYHVVEKGLAGAETRDLAIQMGSLLSQYRPKIVMTMIGGADRIVWSEESLAFRIYTTLRELRVFRLAQLLLWNRWMPEGVKEENVNPQGLDSLEEKFAEFYNTGRDSPDYTHSFGSHLRGEKKYALAEKYHKKLLAKFPNHNAAKIELGYLWKELGKNKESEEIFRKAIEIAESSPDKSDDYTWGYIGLAELYGENFGDWRRSSQVLDKALERLPDWHFLYLFQAKAFSKIGDSKRLEEILLKGIEKCPNEHRLYFHLADFYRARNQVDKARRIKELGIKVRALDATQVETKKWYQQMHKAVVSAGAKHYVLGYPRKPISFYTQYFDPNNKVTFVGNEKIFQEEKPIYSEYFIDEFGGDFGHLAPKAAAVVAQTIYEKMKEEKECD